ncbi:MAG TPA: guanylate kinase [Coxiellaceae bacterium]|nr:MAG: guanylate kinase [Gammaproteobacteria bacterium RBG_16_37_9]HBC71730.1 guanylate kinase [Coxiellaceae bacterium]HBY55874.1 guanylate kinase [Coxiellaceae bacterium]
MKPKGILYIVAAASGTGKTSLAEALTKTVDNIKISISHTTRQIRANERTGQNYFFVTPEEFESLIEKNAFLEYAQVFDHYYGTSRKWVEEQLNMGIDVVLDIDWQGARLVREQIQCVSIFLLPPSSAELRLRLERRKREDSQIIEQRLATASSEIAHYKEFDYVVINDKFENALADLQTIVQSQRLRLRYQTEKYATLIEELKGSSPDNRQ